jgi:hypothetical protein
MLQIRVDHHDRVTGRVLQPGQHRRLLAEVAGQLDAADPGVELSVLDHPGPGVVGRAVVDQHQLVPQPGVAEHLGDPVDEPVHPVALVEERRHHGDQHGHRPAGTQKGRPALRWATWSRVCG